MDFFTANLSPIELERLSALEEEVVWHPNERCPHCGDRIFWDTYHTRWFCRSWLYMEGGCPFPEGIPDPLHDALKEMRCEDGAIRTFFFEVTG